MMATIDEDKPRGASKGERERTQTTRATNPTTKPTQLELVRTGQLIEVPARNETPNANPECKPRMQTQTPNAKPNPE